MLDKSVKYKNIIMRIEKDKVSNTASPPVLPRGFSFRYYSGAKDIDHWCEIETSVLEFASVSEAKDYFTKAFLPYENELKNRCLFIADENNLPVATATVWYAGSELGHQAALHWVAVRPKYQGLGLGKTIVQKALQRFSELEPNCDVWLHTQTWSHTAVRLYHKLGFNMLKQDTLAGCKNDFDEAIEILKSVYDEAVVLELAETAL